MRPLAISPETAVKLAEALQVPLERLMHMPQHILLQKMMELAQAESASKQEKESQPSQDGQDAGE
ncbi:YycC family protein [Brevibacillus composti]|uniref:YycC family protein n=1 Tax=Brevibacillus composti TaxID=2796470 RepID=A0A7T5EPF5_9BACL|nr:YycC family protein [Brevibacillus composti]QQE76331.1 YycC family protein [Brevibacillus composti]QUO43358.1 YycC family protein [Brevibacillus composti]